jgi:multiple sugar transport system permease protein
MRATRNSVLIHVAAIAVAIITLAPVLWMFFASIMPQRELIAVPFKWLPQQLDLTRYATILGGGNVGQTFRSRRSTPSSSQQGPLSSPLSSEFSAPTRLLG